MIKPSKLWPIFAVLLFANAGSRQASFLAGNQISIDNPLENLWQGTASFKQFLQIQIQSNGPVGSPVASPNFMNCGTQIVAMSNFIPASKTWYLFNREFFYGATQPTSCPSNFAPSRIVVRSSQ